MNKYYFVAYKKDIDSDKYSRKDFWFDDFNSALDFVTKWKDIYQWSLSKVTIIDKGGNDEK